MYNQKTREWAKHVLWVSRVKLIYARITLTRYTTIYFYLALLSSIILVILQSRTYLGNTEGTQAIGAFLLRSNVSTATAGMSFLQDGDIILCHNIPGQNGANCTTLVHRAHSHMHVRDAMLSFDERDTDLKACATSLMWLGDVLNDARREDFVVALYHIWLFTLSMVTLLNESLPHLFAGLAARALATGWAGFRVQGNKNLYSTYMNVISTGQCDGLNPLESWWDESGLNEIAGLVSNSLNLVLMAALSYKLYKVYASQTFSRVGASTEIHRVYKLVLVLSVILQLAGFLVLAQTGLWISKISFGAIRQLADHFPIYFASLIITVVFEIPWLVLGWISVRKESKILFIIFAIISLFLFGMASLMFFSPLYRFVLGEWTFYATMSITAYVLLIATSVLAVICRLQFGKGLAHFLHVTEALEEGDFTPVYFSKGPDSPSSFLNEKEDLEKQAELESELPVLGYASKAQIQVPAPSHGRKLSTLSLLIEDTQSMSTIKLSSTPSLFHSGMTPKRTSPTAPIYIQPIARSSSNSSNSTSPARSKPTKPIGRRPPNIHVGPTAPEYSYPLPVISGSPVTKQHTRAETVDVRPSRERSPELAKPLQAAVRSRSVPRRGNPGAALPRRPSDGSGVTPPAGYF
ncbi:hypothetical protein B0H17DRAFT_1098091 [Mycena rosella]|uniref:Uncharacterized protein n=1 Tax=Mycena rosella TaxID=1033263 RepID=A0AAD7CPL9_MYCRO|nr:hypothetical protein B0H17DRAFT_1098091 [Mycena rosella]